MLHQDEFNLTEECRFCAHQDETSLLIINRNNKNLIGYTFFDKVKVTLICANIIYYETTKLL